MIRRFTEADQSSPSEMREARREQRQKDKRRREKQLETRFRGLWIPADICNMIESGEIQVIEAYLLATIDRFVSSKGEGCWASNDRLARLLGGITERRVQQMISSLIDKGLVRRFYTREHPRMLETIYSRIRRSKQEDAED
jgi:hypothetical protein